MAGSQNHDEMIPLKFYLSQNYPNPFSEKTRIKYCLAYKSKAEIVILNNNGYIIRKLLMQIQEAGTYEVELDAENMHEGIYYYRLIAGEYVATKKMEIKNEYL